MILRELLQNVDTPICGKHLKSATKCEHYDKERCRTHCMAEQLKLNNNQYEFNFDTDYSDDELEDMFIQHEYDKLYGGM